MAKTHGYYTVKGKTQTYKTLDEAMKAANYKPLIAFVHPTLPTPRKGDRYAAGPVPMYTPVTVLKVDRYATVIFTCLDPMGRHRKFARPVEGFLEDYKRID